MTVQPQACKSSSPPAAPPAEPPFDAGRLAFNLLRRLPEVALLYAGSCSVGGPGEILLAPTPRDDANLMWEVGAVAGCLEALRRLGPQVLTRARLRVGIGQDDPQVSLRSRWDARDRLIPNPRGTLVSEIGRWGVDAVLNAGRPARSGDLRFLALGALVRRNIWHVGCIQDQLPFLASWRFLRQCGRLMEGLGAEEEVTSRDDAGVHRRLGEAGAWYYEAAHRLGAPVAYPKGWKPSGCDPLDKLALENVKEHDTVAREYLLYETEPFPDAEALLLAGLYAFPDNECVLELASFRTSGLVQWWPDDREPDSLRRMDALIAANRAWPRHNRRFVRKLEALRRTWQAHHDQRGGPGVPAEPLRLAPAPAVKPEPTVMTLDLSPERRARIPSVEAAAASADGLFCCPRCGKKSDITIPREAAKPLPALMLEPGDNDRHFLDRTLCREIPHARVEFSHCCPDHARQITRVASLDPYVYMGNAAWRGGYPRLDWLAALLAHYQAYHGYSNHDGYALGNVSRLADYWAYLCKEHLSQGPVLAKVVPKRLRDVTPALEWAVKRLAETEEEPSHVGISGDEPGQQAG